MKPIDEVNARHEGDARPLLITGATGTLGQAVARVCGWRGLPHRLLTRAEMDIADAESIERAVAEYQPWAIVNAAGYVRVDDAETDAERCRRENTRGAFELAAACARHDVKFVTFSSDLVFDGSKNRPYVESDAVAPLNVYGRSKAEAEELVLRAKPDSLVIRTSAFFSPWDEHNFVFAVLQTLTDGGRFTAADDAFISPTYVFDLVHATLDLLFDEERGVWHLANEEAITWAEFARTVAARSGFDMKRIEALPTAALNLRAQRPLYSVLGSERGKLLPSLDDAINRYFSDCGVRFRDMRHDMQDSVAPTELKKAVAT
jgi:dTDP-4-dehydrorhamnose reductase